MLRILFLTLGLALSPLGARAAEPKAGEVGQYVDLVPVGLPIVAKGRLVNYVFVNVRINLTASADAAKLREKEPYFRDALVRAGHRTPFTLAGDYNRIDGPRLAAALQRETALIAGPRAIKSVIIQKQAARRQIVMPKPEVIKPG
jgi:hypothetical protein